MLAVRPVRSPLEDGIAFMSSANFLFPDQFPKRTVQKPA
jgi:hypothetical protein